MKAETLLKVENMTVRFAVKRGRGFGKNAHLHAVDDVSFTVKRGETLAIVGESGSGKTTTALAVARLVNSYKGKVLLGDTDLLALGDEDLRQARARVQFIFQDPYSSLNPRLRASDIVREPMDSLGDMSEAEKSERVDFFFNAVGLRPEQQRLFPHQFSGGQRQRIGIARALATQPELIICDEPVSALDVAVQAQILNLLRKLQKDFGLTYLFISHDLGVVQHMCDSIAVMYMGKIVEHGSRLDIFNAPQHPYTRALLSAVPSVDKARRAQTKRILIPGDPPDPVNLPAGCRFANRCPVVQDICRRDEPELRNGVACHFPNAEL
ncbi:ABC transporter ATP-binding protein [Planktotalea arctica]|uniref:ABC transporter ATP-binding protein n=1 Tax=Planktotalea arctica TaxID=1481893 RepID=UPI00321A3DB4